MRLALWEPYQLYNVLADGIEELLDRVEKAEQALQRVRELHQPQPGEGARYCADCEQRWPCPTIKALEGDG